VSDETVRAMRPSRSGEEWATDEFAADEAAGALYMRAHALVTDDPPQFEAALPVLKEAAATGSPRAAYALVSWYLPPGRVVEPDVTEARRLLLVAAQADIPEAHFDLGIMHLKGEGVEADERTAFEWFLRAAIRGDRDAAYGVGVAYFYGDGVGEDRRLADIWLDRAKELGLDPETGNSVSDGA
jgi:TPR repeat protein